MNDLKRHKEAKHEGIRYPCDQCEFAATRISLLKRHKEAKHEGIQNKNKSESMTLKVRKIEFQFYICFICFSL